MARTGGTFWVPIILVLAPVVGVLALRAPLLNQNGYIDAWFYSGYGWAPTHHLTVFENTYYGARFPVVLLIGLAANLLGATGGYVVLRYAILLGTGLGLYAGVRQFASPRVAAAATVALAADVLYLRPVLWDYVTFVMIPATLAAVALWPRRAGRLGAAAAGGAGALLSAAVFSNPLSAFVLPPLFVVELLSAMRKGDGELMRFVLRILIAISGAFLVFLIGWLAYNVMVGFTAGELLRPTINFLHNDAAISAGYVMPVSHWIFGEPRIWAPPVLVAGMTLVMGRRLLGTDAAASLAQFSILFLLELFLYRFLSTTSVVETWWSYDIAAISVAFASAVLLHEVEGGAIGGKTKTALIAGVLVAALLSGYLIRLWGPQAANEYEKLRHGAPIIVAVVLALAGPAVWRWAPAAGRAVAAAVLLAVVTILALAPARYLGVGRTGEFSAAGAPELDGYGALHTVVRRVAAEDTPASRTLVWYSSQSGALGGIGSLMPVVGGTLNDYTQVPDFRHLDDYERGRLAYPTTARVLLIGLTRSDLAQGLTTLRRAGYRFVAARPESLDGGSLRMQQISLRRLSAGGTPQAVRMTAEVLLAAWHAHDAQRLCWLSNPSLVLSIAIQNGNSCVRGVRAAVKSSSAPRHISSVSISGDTAHVTVSADRTPIVLDRVQSEWLVAAGTPWTG